VWALIGPSLAEPGHIELDSRTVYLDSDELVGSRPEILAGRLQHIRILTTIGVGVHEVMHAKHTKLWVMERDIAPGRPLRQGDLDRRPRQRRARGGAERAHAAQLEQLNEDSSYGRLASPWPSQP
jgi:hypothetical protein